MSSSTKSDCANRWKRRGVEPPVTHVRLLRLLRFLRRGGTVLPVVLLHKSCAFPDSSAAADPTQLSTTYHHLSTTAGARSTGDLSTGGSGSTAATSASTSATNELCPTASYPPTKASTSAAAVLQLSADAAATTEGTVLSGASRSAGGSLRLPTPEATARRGQPQQRVPRQPRLRGAGISDRSERLRGVSEDRFSERGRRGRALHV